MGHQESMEGARALVVGLGRFGGGVGVTRWLRAQGAQVTVTDMAPPEALAESLALVEPLGIETRLGGHKGIDPRAFDLVIINPAVRKHASEIFKTVVDAGTPWTTEINLFCERCPADVIGVTGSFGKSTTCAMLARAIEFAIAHQACDYSAVHLGGNIGHSLLMDLPGIRKSDLVVLEISNAQLEDLPRIEWTPKLAVMTNLMPHHLDRYESFADYINAKLNIVSTTNRRQPVIVGDLHPEAELLLARRLGSDGGRLVHVPTTTEVACGAPGIHNRRNAAIVLTVCNEIGLNENVVRTAIRDFRGLPHRLELVREIAGVAYVNDSKSTAPEATVMALRTVGEIHCFESNGQAVDASEARDRRNVILIVGGQSRPVRLEALANEILHVCRAMICTGESGRAFADAARVTGVPKGNPRTDVQEAATLEDAVRMARSAAVSGDVVLFSPGAPSFDRYANFAERGQCFVELVRNL